MMVHEISAQLRDVEQAQTIAGIPITQKLLQWLAGTLASLVVTWASFFGRHLQH